MLPSIALETVEVILIKISQRVCKLDRLGLFRVGFRSRGELDSLSTKLPSAARPGPF